MKRLSLLLISIFFTSVVSAGAVPAGSLDRPAPRSRLRCTWPVFRWIERLRQGNDVRLEIRAERNAFSVFHEQTKAIDKAIFNQILQSSQNASHLELTSESTVLVYDVNDNLKLEQHLGRSPGAKSAVWFKRESIRIGSYPLDQWGGFIAEALHHGLSMYDVSENGKILLVSLGFKQTGPDLVRFDNQSLVLSDEFYDHMMLSWHHKPVAGANGFAILVHDPHWSASGALQLVPGLKALLGSNQQHQFIFLVEGEYGETRQVGFNSLDLVVDAAAKSGGAEPLVYDMVSRFLIDSAMAYRLLYDRHLPVFAIDDARYLETTSPGTRPAERFKTVHSIRKLYEATSHIDWAATPQGKEAQKSINEVFRLADAYMTADIRDARGQGLVDYYDQLAMILDKLVNVGQGLKETHPGIQIESEISFIKGQAGAYQAQRQTFENALRRNVMMVKYISEHARTRDLRIPVAFIGNFHTDGITRELRKQSIGYIVVEPRFNSVSGPKEFEDFDRLLYEDQRKAYLKSLASTRKLAVAPTVFDVQEYYAPHLKRQSVRVAERQRLSALSFGKLPSKQVDFQAFNNALRENGALTGAAVEFDGAGGGERPPPGLDGAFAFFEPGGEGKGPRFLVFDAQDEGWRHQGRYKYLKEAKLVLPFEGDGNRSRGKVVFYQDPVSKSMFAAFYEPQSKRFYLFEGEKAISALPIMLSLKPRKDQGVLIHTRVAELRPGNQGGNDDG